MEYYYNRRKKVRMKKMGKAGPSTAKAHQNVLLNLRIAKPETLATYMYFAYSPPLYRSSFLFRSQPTMFPLFRKNFLFPSSGCSSLISQQVSKLRTLLIPSSHPCKQLEEDNVRVSVWWNIDDCRVPSDFSVWKIAPSIIRTVRANGIKAPIDIRAYGDVYHFSTFQRIALFLTGIHLHHVAPGWGPAGWDLIDDLYSWCRDNPPPIHLFVISGDDDGDSPVMQYLHKFRMRNYNILVAYSKASQYFEPATAATILWQWSSILKGKDLTGKHFNYSPDDPFDSWYGDLKVPLENPFSALEEPTSSENAL